MRDFDINGLRLAEYQGRIFEESVRAFDCSTKVFLRRFLHSDYLKKLDENESALFSLDPRDALADIERQFGASSYGKEKWSPDAMFWIGYLYRYISFTRETGAAMLMKVFKPEKLKELYYAYHTQSEEWVIASLLELYSLDESFFDKNARLKKALVGLSSAEGRFQ